MRTREELGLSDHRYRSLVEQVPAVSYVARWEPGSPFAYVSPQIEELLGFPAERWVAEPELWAERLHPDDRELVLMEEMRTFQHEVELRPRVPHDRGRRLGHVGVGARRDRARRGRPPDPDRGRDGRHHRAQARRGARPALPRRGRHDPARPAHRPDRRAAQPPRARAARLRGRRADRQGLVRRRRPRGRPRRRAATTSRASWPAATSRSPTTRATSSRGPASAARSPGATRSCATRRGEVTGHPRLGRGHHRAPARGGGDLPPRLLRPADRPAEPRAARGASCAAASPARAAPAARSRCCSSTSTTSSSSTTRFGHGAGDRLLRRIAGRLRAASER